MTFLLYRKETGEQRKVPFGNSVAPKIGAKMAAAASFNSAERAEKTTYVIIFFLKSENITDMHFILGKSAKMTIGITRRDN